MLAKNIATPKLPPTSARQPEYGLAARLKLEDCNPRPEGFRPGLALSQPPATILLDSAAMAYTTSKWPVHRTTVKSKKKAGVPWTALPPSLPHTLHALHALHGSREGIVLSSLSLCPPLAAVGMSRAWKTRTGLQACGGGLVVCRRGRCAVQDEPGWRRS